MESEVYGALAIASTSSTVQHLTTHDLGGRVVVTGDPTSDLVAQSLLAAMQARGVYLFDAARVVVLNDNSAAAVSAVSVPGIVDILFGQSGSVQAWNAVLATLGFPPALQQALTIDVGPGGHSKYIDAASTIPNYPYPTTFNVTIPGACADCGPARELS